jgi:hypothetical protein
MVLQHCERVVNWELSEFDGAEKLCNKHAKGLLSRRTVWEPHIVNGVVCDCGNNAMIPWLITTFAHSFPLVHDDHVILGVVVVWSPILCVFVMCVVIVCCRTQQGT